MSLIESRDILTKLCSNDYYRGDDVQCAIQRLAEGGTINRVRTLEDVGMTVIDETLKDELMKAKDGKGAFDDVNPKWLSLLLTFLSTDPPRREITVRAESGGKSVNITYDPHDAGAVQAAETWRKALFSGVAQFKAVEPVSVKVGDIAPFGDEYRRQKDELKKASAPLVEYLKRHGDPHTTITVTRESAVERQDERGVTFESEKPAETVKRGRWEKSDIPCEKYVCSVCGGACWYYDCGGDVAKSRFCPNCGARMENALGNGGD